jgi:hypothetical protein
MSNSEKTKPACPAPSASVVNSTLTGRQVEDLIVPAEKILHFMKIDLGTLDCLPDEEQDLTALSIRMNAAFTILCNSVLELIAQDHEDIPRRVLQSVTTELALDFIERYGLLAFFSANLLTCLWPAQRPKSEGGSKCLREVGARLAIFAMAAQGVRTRKTIDIGFILFKRQFLAELQRLSSDLGALAPDQPRADQMLELVRTGQYERLGSNLRLLEEFLRSPHPNARLRAKNAISADQLAEYGIGKELREKRQTSMTPDWFFYTWIGWSTNKSPRTVRREIQTSETRFRRNLNRLAVTRGC